MKVLLGFAVGSGAPVEIPLAHMFVTGQTQLSGKTTTLRAVVERSGRRALAFVTKRGEEFAGRPIRPYLPRQGEQPIHWRMVETILASALEQKSLRYERLQIINAAKGARSLDDVQANVRRLLAKSKSAGGKEIYTLLDEYLELVLPQMRSLRASDVLDLQPGLNVMDLSGIAAQTQAMVIRAALERINRHETHVLTVLPEAWEFAPRSRSAPAKDEAIAMARKGAAHKVQNFLLVDSQDIAGVEPVVRQACSVWLLGVQREINETKRALQMMKAAGVATPTASDVAQLEIGHFYACFGKHAIKTYVQPGWMNAASAEQVATGQLTVDLARQLSSLRAVRETFEQVFKEEDSVNAAEAQALRDENDRLKEENADLRRRIEALERSARAGDGRAAPSHQRAANTETSRASVAGSERTPRAGASTPAEPRRERAFSVDETFDNEALYQAFKARLIEELPSDPRAMEIVLARPELRVKVQRHVIEVDGRSLRGRIARLIAADFWSKARTSADVLEELLRRGADRPSNIELGNEMKALCDMGFFTRDNKWYALVSGMKVNVVES